MSRPDSESLGCALIIVAFGLMFVLIGIGKAIAGGKW